jgi:hypothetical protein
MIVAVEELPDGTVLRLPAYDPVTDRAARNRAWKAAHPPTAEQKAADSRRTSPRARARYRALTRLAHENPARFFVLMEEELAREREAAACAG